jgi:predicted phage-related endonuclease
LQVHQLVQGSAEWLAHRARYFNASDAPAMMGCSPYETRDQLVARLATGLRPEVDARTQQRFDAGHRYEAQARPLAEAIIGETLYPVVATEGKNSASSDGLTMDESINWEHKSLNDELRSVMVEGCDGSVLPLYNRVQMDAQNNVFRCEKTLFMASKWEGETLVEERHCWYEGDAELAARIEAGWAILEADVASYIPPAAAPLVVAEPVQALPAVSIRVDGSIAVINNFDAFEAAVRDFIDNRLIRSPQTDQDFATLEQQIKAIKGAREAVKSGMAQMRAQIEPVDTASKRAELVDKLLQTNQSMAEKLLSSEKESRKRELLTDVQTKLGDHLRGQNERLGGHFMPQIAADFAGAIYGKKSLDSMRSAVNSTLANAKIEANAAADKIQRNLNVLADKAKDHDFLFNDKATLVLMENDHFSLMVDKRISDHVAAKQAEEERTRERIRAEEQAKAEKEAREKVLAEQEAERKAAETATQAAARDQVVTGTGVIKMTAMLDDAGGAPVMLVERIAPANVVPMRAAAPAPAAPTTPPTMKLGDINAMLAPIQLSVDGLTKLGFPPAATQQNAKLYHHRDLSAMCAALHDLLDQVQAKQAA